MRGTDSNSDIDGGAGRHRRPEPYRGRHHQTEDSTTTALRWALRRPVAAALLVSIGLGSLSAGTGSVTQPQKTSAAADPAVMQMAVDRMHDEASRSLNRAAPTVTTSPPPAPSPSAPRPSAAASGTPPPATTSPSPRIATTPSDPQPVAGLTRAQMHYAATIVRVGQQMRLPQRAYIVAIATALQESNLLNLANWGVSQSLNLAHDGVGGDHDSVGLFQQRPSSGWGAVEQLMDPAFAAGQFYRALNNIAGWQSMSVAGAAQAVQVSAFPDAYAQHQAQATLIAQALS